MEEKEQAFISWIAAKLEANDETDLKTKLQKLGKDGIKQAYDEFLTESTDQADVVEVNKDGGKLKYLQELRSFQQGGALQLTPEDRTHWNGFVDFVAQKGMAGNPALNQRNTGMSKQLFDEYNTSTGKKYNYDQFIPAVQSNINTYKAEMVNRVNSGVVGSQLAPGQATVQNYMPGASPTDGWAGTKTTSTKFPAATLVKNGVTTVVPNNYMEQAVTPVNGAVNQVRPGDPTFGYGPTNQSTDASGMRQKQMTRGEWEQVRKETGWPDVYKGNTQSANRSDVAASRIEQILGRIRNVAPATNPLSATQPTQSTGQALAKHEDGGKLEYLKCLQTLKKGGKVDCGCSGAKLSLKKEAGGSLGMKGPGDAFKGTKAVKGLNPKIVKMGQGVDGVLGGKPALKRASGGKLNAQAEQPAKGQPANGQAQQISPEQMQENKLNMEVDEQLIKNKQGMDAMTPMQTLMEQIRPKQIKAKPEKRIRLMVNKGKTFGVEA